MKKKIIFVLLILFGIIAISIGFVFVNKIEEKKSKVEILDATYSCNSNGPVEQFYEDNGFIYYFPCVKSNSVYVKLENGNKVLVVEALNNEQVTIGELIAAGLEVIKEEK